MNNMKKIGEYVQKNKDYNPKNHSIVKKDNV